MPKGSSAPGKVSSPPAVPMKGSTSLAGTKDGPTAEAPARTAGRRALASAHRAAHSASRPAARPRRVMAGESPHPEGRSLGDGHGIGVEDGGEHLHPVHHAGAGTYEVGV